MMHIDQSSSIILSLCDKMFKRCLLDQCENMVDQRITNYEDGACTYLCIAHANIVTVIENKYYHYRQNYTDTISKSVRDDYLLNLHLVYNTLKNGFSTARYSKLLLHELAYFINVGMYHSVKHLLGIDGCCYSYSYLFPFEAINKGCRLLLYGAGEVGIAYYRQLITTGYCSEVIWVDRNWETMSAKGMAVKSPKKLYEYDFDTAVIAILEEGRAQGIRLYLIEQNIANENIIWRNPVVNTI